MNEKTPVKLNLYYSLFLIAVILISIQVIAFNNLLSFRHFLNYVYILFIIVALYEFVWQICKMFHRNCSMNEIKMFAGDGTTDKNGIRLDYIKRTFSFCFAVILLTVTLYVRNGT